MREVIMDNLKVSKLIAQSNELLEISKQSINHWQDFKRRKGQNRC